MIAMTLVGAAMGATLWFLAWTVLPARVNHAVTLGRIDAARATSAASTLVPGRTAAGRFDAVKVRVGRRAESAFRRRGITLGKLRQDLAILNRTL
ncbi:MAG: hypothetical protein EPN43_08540, partial [Jatrophihabitans sp.]